MTTAVPPNETQPFRFLDLPKELRLMIYERLVNRSHEKIELGVHRTLEDHATFVMTERSAVLVIPASVPPVYLTCKLIHSEATAMLKELDYRNSRPRMILNLEKLKVVSLVQVEYAAWIARGLSICYMLRDTDPKFDKRQALRIQYGRSKDSPVKFETFIDFKTQTIDKFWKHDRLGRAELEVALQCPASSNRDIELCTNELGRTLKKILKGNRQKHIVTVHIAPDNKRVETGRLSYDPTVLRIGKSIDMGLWEREWM